MSSDTDKIIFEGDPLQRDEAIAFINQQLAIHGNIGPAFGNYSAGLLAVAGLSTVTVIEHEDRYDISSFSGSHDLEFSIDRTSGELSNACVGTIAPMPQFEDCDIPTLKATPKDKDDEDWDSPCIP